MPFSSPIFRKVWLGAFVLSAGTLIALDLYLVRFTSLQHLEYVQARIQAEGRILAGEAAKSPPEEWQKWALGAGKRAEARVTIIAPNGKVLADSEQDPRELGDFGERTEVRVAFSGQLGTAVRYSPSSGRDVCFVALPLLYGGGPGYALELAIPLNDTPGASTPFRKQMLAVVIAAAVLALAIAYIFSLSFTRRIERLKAYAENLVGVPRTERALESGNDELSDLGRSLERAAARVRELLGRLNLESAQRERILASMVEGVLAVDRDLRVTFSNQAFLRAVGSPLPVAQHSRLIEIVRDPEVVDIVKEVLASKEPKKQRLYFPVPEARSFELLVSPFEAPSGAGAIVLLHDVTDLERLERVRKDFVANVSHELRTPLTAIHGYAETLLDGGLEDPENNRNFIEIIRTHATRLSNIASDLLRLSELEADRVSLEPECISVRAALDTALRTVEPEAELRGIKITCGAIEAPEILGEKGRLEQVLINLLDNAVKFNREGGEVRVEVRPTPEGKTHVVISDTGIGIPSTDLSRIFERFYRVDKARSRELGGTGLGLSIVRHIVERMHGTVRVESQLGKGSTFTVILPAVSEPIIKQA